MQQLTSKTASLKKAEDVEMDEGFNGFENPRIQEKDTSAAK